MADRSFPTEAIFTFIKKTVSFVTDVTIMHILGDRDAADIYEADVVFNKNEAAWYGFNYYGGISKCYKKTIFDPYYNSATYKRSPDYIREGWLKREISCVKVK